MTVIVFLGALLGAMALGIPIAFSLLICGAALMLQQNMFDPQILAQNVIQGADSGAVFHAGWRDHERRWIVATHC
jgi:TRAP-type transport system large permease protein